MQRNPLHIVQSYLLKITGRRRFLSYDDVDSLNDSLAEKIDNSGYAPDVVVGISKGGEYPAFVISCDFGADIASVKVNHYGIGLNGFQIEDIVGVYRLARLFGYRPSINVQQDVAREVIASRRVLIVDDDSYSGLTLEAALRSINEKEPLEVKTAVLHTYTGNPCVDFAGMLSSRESLYRKRQVYPWSLLSPHYLLDETETEHAHSFTS